MKALFEDGRSTRLCDLTCSHIFFHSFYTVKEMLLFLHSCIF